MTRILKVVAIIFGEFELFTELDHALIMKACNGLEHDGSLKTFGTIYNSCLGLYPLLTLALTALLALTESLIFLAILYDCVVAYSYWMDKEDEDKVD